MTRSLASRLLPACLVAGALVAASPSVAAQAAPNQKLLDFCLDWAERLLLRAEEREHPEWKLMAKPGHPTT